MTIADNEGIKTMTGTQDEHDGLTHLVDAEDADTTACGAARTIWVSATQTPAFATCEACSDTPR